MIPERMGVSRKEKWSEDWGLDNLTLSDQGEEEEPAKDAERSSQWRERSQKSQVSWKPNEESVPRTSKGSVMGKAAFWSNKTNNENGALELAMWRSLISRFRTILVEQ